MSCYNCFYYDLRKINLWVGRMFGRATCRHVSFPSGVSCIVERGFLFSKLIDKYLLTVHPWLVARDINTNNPYSRSLEQD